jgi:hypothetical protein
MDQAEDQDAGDDHQGAPHHGQHLSLWRRWYSRICRPSILRRSLPISLGSLLHMINFNVEPLCGLLSILINYEHSLGSRISQPSIPRVPSGSGVLGLAALPPLHTVEDEEKTRFGQLLDFASHVVRQLNLEAAQHRIKLFKEKLEYSLSTHDLLAEVRALREAIEGEVANRCFYYYPTDKANLIRNASKEWRPALDNFKAAENDIVAAVDCYALGHHNAAVFHLMKTMEIAVQAFGKKLGVNLVKRHPTKRVAELSWDQILNELNPKLRTMSQKTAAQKRRYEKFSSTQSYLYGVKDAWRNPTMHPRQEGYTEPQARDIMNHVRAFMNELAGIL